MSMEKFDEKKGDEDFADDIKDEKKSLTSKSSVTKKLGRTVVPVALALGMVGCSGEKESEKNKQQTPLEDPNQEDVLNRSDSLEEEIESVHVNEDGELEVNRSEDEDKVYFENYNINFSDQVLKALAEYEKEYNIYEVKKDTQVEKVKNFVDALNIVNLEYEKKSHPAVEGDSLHHIDQSNYIWKKGNDFIHYRASNDLLTMVFDEGQSIPNLDIVPGDKNSVEEGIKQISSDFFSQNFDYRVDSIVKDGDNYRVEYSRLLDGIPIKLDIGSLKLILTADGKLKEGWFSLAEFEKASKERLNSSQSIVDRVNDINAHKILSFTFPNFETEIEKFGPYGYSSTGMETGMVNLKKANIAYRYDNKFQNDVSPYVNFEGTGFVEIEDENFDVDYELMIRALE